MKKLIFWGIQLTWGVVENFLGLLLFLVLVIFKQKPKRFHQMVYFEIGNFGGGFNCGFVGVVSKNPSDYILRHEHGHFIQNTFFGPLETLIQLASLIRFWYRKYLIKFKGKKYSDLPDYDSIWFEGQATKFGYKYLVIGGIKNEN